VSLVVRRLPVGSFRATIGLLAHSIHSRYFGCFSGSKDRVFSAYVAIKRRIRSARSQFSCQSLKLGQPLFFFIEATLL
jgi:hypothetical protein